MDRKTIFGLLEPIFMDIIGEEAVRDETLEDLEAENEKLRQELELMKEKTVKERIYDHVHVSVRTMDIFIGVMVVLFVVVVVLGILNK